jgi:hypothetical protein
MLSFLRNKLAPIDTTTKPPVELPFGWGEGEPPTPDEIVDEPPTPDEISNDSKQNIEVKKVKTTI